MGIRSGSSRQLPFSLHYEPCPEIRDNGDSGQPKPPTYIALPRPLESRVVWPRTIVDPIMTYVPSFSDTRFSLHTNDRWPCVGWRKSRIVLGLESGHILPSHSLSLKRFPLIWKNYKLTHMIHNIPQSPVALFPSPVMACWTCHMMLSRCGARGLIMFLGSGRTGLTC